jgi:hypothetical protein
MDSRSGHGWVFAVILFVAIGVAAWDAEAQCSDLQCWVVSLSCTSRAAGHTGNAICVDGACICEVACNNNSDCQGGFGCSDGRCRLCGTDGAVCGDPPDPCAGKKCDDGKACNGIEGCRGGNCFIATPAPNCNDNDESTNDRCIDGSALNTSRCDNYRPSKCSRRPGTNGELDLRPVGSGRLGFVWSGRIDSDLSSKPGDVRVILTGGKDAPLLDAQVGAGSGSWRQRSGTWTYTASNRNAGVRRITLNRAGTFRVEGTVTGTGVVMPERDAFRSTGAMIIDFVAPDVVDPCVGIPVPVCVPFGDGMRCRQDRIGGPQ